MTLDGELTAILDVTDVTIQQQLGTVPQELTDPWLVPQARCLAGQGPLPPTQRLGAEAFASTGVAGLRDRSAHTRTAWACWSFPPASGPGATGWSS
jgi:hypothetical protein